MTPRLNSAVNEEHIGSDFDAFLQSEGLREDAEAVATKQVVAFQIAQRDENPEQYNAASIALLESWIAEAPTSPEAIEEAEADLRDFKQRLNATRREAGARLHFPDVS